MENPNSETHQQIQNNTQEQQIPIKLLSAKASVLIQPRLRAPSTRLLYSSNINADVKGRIINTLLRLKNNGLEEQPVKIVSYYLNHLAVNVDLENPEKVKPEIFTYTISIWDFPCFENVHSVRLGSLAYPYCCLSSRASFFFFRFSSLTFFSSGLGFFSSSLVFSLVIPTLLPSSHMKTKTLAFFSSLS